MKTKLLLSLALFVSLSSVAQTGGLNSFPFLDLIYNGRSAGLGGDFITSFDKDISMGVANPSSLNPKMHNTVSFNHAFHPGGINHGMFNYGFGLKDYGTMVGYIKYVDYGKFDRTSVNGTTEGTFRPFEMIAGAGFGRQINPRLSIGAKANIIYSQLETYSAFGASIDLAGSFRDEEKGYIVTALVKNFGMQFKGHTMGNRAPLPVEFQLAGAYKLPHAPFRITLLAHHLNKWDITYNDPNLQPTVDPLTGDIIPVKRPGFFEKLAHHFSYQLEIIAGKRVHLRTGFDYHRRKELALEQRPGLAGFSFGAGLYFKKFTIDYGFLVYSRAGFNNILTITTNLSQWRR